MTAFWCEREEKRQVGRLDGKIALISGTGRGSSGQCVLTEPTV